MIVDEGTHILYMEDDPGLARLLQKHLRRLGYDVETVTNGEEGLERLAVASFDLALVDYNMPGCGGLEVIRTIAGGEKPVPTIMVTGNGNEKIAVEALKLGATDYIVKDADMGYLELLPIIIEQVLQNQRLIREKELYFAAVKENEERYRRLVELSPDGIAIVVDNRFEFINPAGISLLGAAGTAELLGKEVESCVPPEFKDLIREHLELMSRGGDNVPWIEERFLRLDGTAVDVELSGVPFAHHGQPAIQIIFRDVTERIQAKQRLELLAHFDPLTALPNRALFFDRLDRLISHATRYRETFAILFIDLDRFKEVNDSFGHAAGDLLLTRVAERLRDTVRASDTVARVGGDEFTVLLSRIAAAADAEQVANKIVDAISEPFQLGSQRCSIGACVGISLFPEDGTDVDTLLKEADAAMYQAKQSGRGTYRIGARTERIAMNGYGI